MKELLLEETGNKQNMSCPLEIDLMTNKWLTAQIANLITAWETTALFDKFF